MKFKQWHEENKHSIYNDPIGAMEQAFEAGQQQYKSLVKTVDADNLPNGEVLIKSYNDVYLGEISLNTDNNLTLTECDDTKLNINNSTHYIEQKDLLKLITNK